MSLIASNIFKSITTSLPRTSIKYTLVQNRISFDFAINLRCKYSSTKNTTDQTSNPDGLCVRKALFTPVQCEKNKKHRKVTIVGGGGNMGQITGYSLLERRFCDELVLFDLPTTKAVNGVALDILGGLSYRNYPKVKVCTTGEKTKDSDLLIICSGKPVAKGQSRLDALQDNVEIFGKLIPKLAYFSPNCVMLIASNPVDVMTYAAWKFSGFPYQRVIGTGTELDTSRFKYFLSKRLDISPKSINAWIIGEHGLSCVPCWSTVNVAGTRLRDIHASFGLKDDPENWIKLKEEVQQIANNIKNARGFTSYAIAMCASLIAQAILSDAQTIHAVSTCCNCVHGFKVKSFMSLPAVVGNSGVKFIIRQVLDCDEKEKLVKSAAILDKALCKVKW